MSNDRDHLDDLHDIRDIMHRSTKFLSLNGFAGVFIGVIALLGAGIAFWYLKNDPSREYFDSPFNIKGMLTYTTIRFILIDAVVVLICAVLTGLFFSWRKSKRLGLPFFDSTARLALINLLIPLGAGGVLCAVLIYHGVFFMLSPLTLIFYGLALVNVSKHTAKEVRALGLAEILLGLISSVIVGEALIFWAIGFGLFHIIFGIVMYRKYERKTETGTS